MNIQWIREPLKGNHIGTTTLTACRASLAMRVSKVANGDCTKKRSLGSGHKYLDTGGWSGFILSAKKIRNQSSTRFFPKPPVTEYDIL